MNASAADIRVMSLNLRFGLADDGENRWDRRKVALAPLFSRFAPDFLAVQEANLFQKDFIAGILPGHLHYGVRQPAPPFWQNNAVFYKREWSLSISRHFFLSPTPDVPSRFTQSRWPRQCSLGVLAKGGRRLAFADTHFDFAENVQNQSALLVQQAIEECAPGMPAIIAGDFNTRPGSSCHALFTCNTRDRNPLLGPPFRDALESSCTPGTHHGFTGHADEKTGRIDWILFRGAMALKESFVITESFEGFYPSDHFPVMAVLELR
ncbi:MAG: endonuclease/exonuclease/phosphatase family protein [Thermodesulfobacteriota bacterium]